MKLIVEGRKGGGGLLKKCEPLSTRITIQNI